MFPLIEGRWRLISVETHRQLPRGYEPELNEIQTILDQRAWPGVRLHTPVWLGSFQIHHRHVQQYRHGRVFLAGDAAHIHSPVGGQGMNTSMQDAYNLAWKLALVIKGQASPDLLDSYQAERLEVARQLVQGTDAATRMVTLRHPLAQQLRNHLMSHLSQHEVIRQRMRNEASELAIHYPNSPLNVQHWPKAFFGQKGVAAGDRMPDSLLEDASGQALRLYDLLRGPYHSLLIFPGESEQDKNLSGSDARFQPLLARVLEPLQALQWEHAANKSAFIRCFWLAGDLPAQAFPGVDVFRDPEARLQHRLGIRQPAYCLIRPDGYLACRSQPARPDELKTYLSKVFQVPV
jgi:hypothetical protein